jgi:hypothetical protein
MKNLDFSEACDKLAEIIMTGDEYAESYGLMIMVFHNRLLEGDTPRMALAIAKDAIAERVEE